jgi:hypothetical protein
MVNETRAYLMHTPDSRFFNARDVDLALSRLAALRAMFLVGMPNGRLRDCTPAPGGARPRLRITAAAARSPRSRRGRGRLQASAEPERIPEMIIIVTRVQRRICYR